jgi:riboflavin kinase/FMN adenylyltransferase
MIVTWDLDAAALPAGPVVLALGTFDGVHRGHQAVIEEVRARARATGGPAVVVTFDPHPVTVIAAPREPFLLSTIEERLPLLAAAGADAAVVVRFNEAVRQMSARAWLDLLGERLRPHHIAASSTHAFGRGREGTPTLLQEWAAPRGVRVTIVPPVHDGGAMISSTAIRERLRAGDVRTAAVWLGRWYGVRGEVVAGEGRGRQIGVPTANLQHPQHKLLPARGVYAAYATVGGKTFQAAVNVGVRPTFGSNELIVEAHLLDAAVELRGKTLELAFVARLRDERRFPNVDALRAQLTEDLATVRSILEESHVR